MHRLAQCCAFWERSEGGGDEQAKNNARNAGLGNPQLNAAGPPTPYLPPRPNSDPSVPQASESISGRRPGPPSTPKRGSANPPQAPSTLPKPVRASGSQFSPAGTPTKPSRKRSSSTSALPLSAVTLTPSGTFQCSGLTQAGQRCKKMVKVNATLTSVLGDDEDEDGGIQVYCAQHKEKVLDKKEFLSPVTGEYVKFSGKPLYLASCNVQGLIQTGRIHTRVPRSYYSSSLTCPHDKNGLQSRQRRVYLWV